MFVSPVAPPGVGFVALQHVLGIRGGGGEVLREHEVIMGRQN